MKDRECMSSCVSRLGFGICPKPTGGALVKWRIEYTEKVKNTYNNSCISIPLYRESDTKLYLPKFLGVEKFGTPTLVSLPAPQQIACAFSGELRPLQREVVDKYLTHIGRQYRANGFAGGILGLYTACGKTVIALNIISALRVKTLILCHKEFLMNQWIERMKQFLPTARVGFIKQGNIDVEDKDVVVASVQSMAMRTYDAKVFDGFGMLVCDECHHMGAEVFNRALHATNFMYSLGLSATLERKDGMEHLFRHHLGPVVCKITDRGNIASTIHVRVRSVDFVSADTKSSGKIDFPALISLVANNARRSEEIVNDLCSVLRDSRRVALVLSDRRMHLKELADLLQARGISTGFYIGGMSQEELDASVKSSRVLLGTYNMASEGMDVPTLNTLVLSTPKSDVEQALGRILRRIAEGVPPLVYDYLDTGIGIMRGMLNKRITSYKRNNARVTFCSDCEDTVQEPPPVTEECLC